MPHANAMQDGTGPRTHVKGAVEPRQPRQDGGKPSCAGVRSCRRMPTSSPKPNAFSRTEPEPAPGAVANGLQDPLCPPSACLQLVSSRPLLIVDIHPPSFLPIPFCPTHISAWIRLPKSSKFDLFPCHFLPVSIGTQTRRRISLFQLRPAPKLQLSQANTGSSPWSRSSSG